MADLPDIPEISGKKFQAVKQLGKGGFGAVYLAETPEGCKYAIKIINIGSDGAKYVNSEREILKRMDHPNVIKIFDDVLNTNLAYLVLEYAPNGNLRQFIERYRTLNESTARKYFVQISRAIQYLHDNRVVHRDIKPENVLLDCNCNAKVTDFGLAAEYNETLLNSVVGTRHYIPPEIEANQPYDGKKADIFCLGVLLCDMLHGSPINCSGVTMGNCSHLLPNTTSNACKVLLTRMCKRDPTQRPNISEILDTKWTKNETETSLASTFIQDMANNTELMILGGVVAGIALVFGALAYSHYSQNRRRRGE